MKIQDITEGYGRYYCSTDKKWKTRKGPKQTRKTESVNQGVAEASLGNVLPWPEVANKISSAMKAMGWKVQRKGDDAFMFSTKGAEDESQYYMVMIDNEGNGMFTYALGTFEGGRPDIGEQGTLPTTAASVSEVLMAIRDGYGLNEQGVAEEKLEETYDGDEFFEAYGELWYNEDEQLDEAEYQGRSVPLGKPMQGDVKKFKVYVKNDKGNVVKVNFGDPDMKIRKSNPKARKSFRARHNCDNPGPRDKARYWSCRKW
jgi:hypothetical protein